MNQIVNDMDEIKGFSEDAYQVAEATIIRDALSVYIMKTARENPNHDDPDYKTLMAYLALVYKKYQQLAATPCKVDESGRLVIRPNLRTDFDLN